MNLDNYIIVGGGGQFGKIGRHKGNLFRELRVGVRPGKFHPTDI
jgi:hypothetical protein